ncbi:ATP-dependent sacrificial sulfur transferase LarE [Georgenia yuyongxinii]|uniref:ATP-dependent sacrificial sulfur transferase LarE n=1 Tax=Georgenia yuyongxinii TaxID=2589797 RepID=A0A5B8C229_9MICO|nr:ATP-dependent sacrificial sulfur transferase LarE [Georgenia yuyongxinii]QDC24729.1 ATP-dependent sacrificial sulfur transferase LarE [Georgenia yuyongxinii]
MPARFDKLEGATRSLADAVAAELAGAAPLGVAYSGGVDSALLLALAVRALGAENVVALLGVSPSLARSERRLAHETAAFIGARVVEIKTHEGENPDYAKNDVDRCFFCKDELFARISDEVVAAHGLAAVAYGENADDAKRPDRPGSQAATNHRVLRPLSVAGLTKLQVREVARAIELPVADKPAAPCLASRIPHGQAVTPEKLRQVERAEEVLRELGFTDGRVRHHGDIARIELPTAEIARAAQDGVREELQRGVSAAGFRFVVVDLRGIQSGAFTLPLLQVGTRA